MPFPIKQVGGGDGPRETCPAENMRGRLIRIFYCGHLPNTYEPEKAPQEQLVLLFELEAQDSEGRHFILSRNLTYSLHEKSTLTKWFQPILGDKWPKDGQQFNITDLLALDCMVNVVEYLKKDGTKGVKIGGISKLPRGMFGFDSDSDIVCMAYDDPQWEDSKLVPKWVKEMCLLNTESKVQSKPANSMTQSRQAQNNLNLGGSKRPEYDPDDVPY